MVQPGILALSGQSQPQPTSGCDTHCPRLPLLSSPPVWGELRPRVIGKDAFPIDSWEEFIFLIFKPFYPGPVLFSEGNCGY